LLYDVFWRIMQKLLFHSLCSYIFVSYLIGKKLKILEKTSNTTISLYKSVF